MRAPIGAFDAKSVNGSVNSFDNSRSRWVAMT